MLSFPEEFMILGNELGWVAEECGINLFISFQATEESPRLRRIISNVGRLIQVPLMWLQAFSSNKKVYPVVIRARFGHPDWDQFPIEVIMEQHPWIASRLGVVIRNWGKGWLHQEVRCWVYNPNTGTSRPLGLE